MTAIGQTKKEPVEPTEAFMKFTIVLDNNPPIELAASLGSESRYSHIQNERSQQVICNKQPFNQLKESGDKVNTSTKTEVVITPVKQIDNTLTFNLVLSYYIPISYDNSVSLTKDCILKTAKISGIELNTVEKIVYGEQKIIPLDNGSKMTIKAIREN